MDFKELKVSNFKLNITVHKVVHKSLTQLDTQSRIKFFGTVVKSRLLSIFYLKRNF